MIGPVYPYKGGIAHYTSLMVRALSKEHTVTMISYKLQYPKILYPRSSQKDYENISFQVNPTHYLINTINPLSYFQTAGFIKKLQPELVILQWWHPFFSFCYWSLANLLRKYSKVLFLCHNVFPHEKFPMQRLLARMTLGKGNAFIVQSKQDEQDLLGLLPNATLIRVVLPTFHAFNMSGIGKNDARKKLEIETDARVLLFFGFVREYKGLKHLLAAMPMIVEALPRCKLLIVGDILDNEKEDYLQRIKQTGCQESIMLFSEYVSDNEVEYYFSACDLVVLPYESATQSGVVQIAYGFEKPVVVTSVGGLPEVVLDGKTGFIVPPNDHEKIADTVIRFFALDEDGIDAFAKGIREEADKYSWDRMNEIISQLYISCTKDKEQS